MRILVTYYTLNVLPVIYTKRLHFTDSSCYIIFFLDKDLNECEKYENLCGENAQCRNTIGSYKCFCLPGYHGDGQLCAKGMKRDFKILSAVNDK